MFEITGGCWRPTRPLSQHAAAEEGTGRGATGAAAPRPRKPHNISTLLSGPLTDTRPRRLQVQARTLPKDSQKRLKNARQGLPVLPLPIK